MSSVTTCYECAVTAALKCMNPACSHYFCSNHGDFICADCHLQSAQKQVVTVKRQEMHENTTNIIFGIFGAILAGIVALVIGIIKAVFESL